MNMSITHYTKNTIKHNTNHSLTLQHHKLKQKSQIKTQIISNLKKNVFNNLKISVFFFEKRPEKIIKIQIQKKKKHTKHEDEFRLHGNGPRRLWSHWRMVGS